MSEEADTPTVAPVQGMRKNGTQSHTIYIQQILTRHRQAMARAKETV
jgi:hypothetical protein